MINPFVNGLQLVLINFHYGVTRGSLSFYCCDTFQLQTTHMVRWQLLERWVHSLSWASFTHTTSIGKHGRRLLEKGYNSQRTKQWTQPIRGSSARECGGRSSKWLWLRHLPLHCKAQGLHLQWLPVTLGGCMGSWRLYQRWAGTQQEYEELHASTQIGHDELYAGMQQRHEEFLIMRNFSDLAL